MRWSLNDQRFAATEKAEGFHSNGIVSSFWWKSTELLIPESYAEFPESSHKCYVASIFDCTKTKIIPKHQ